MPKTLIYTPSPPTLSQLVRMRKEMHLVSRDGLVAFPFHWQIPAATEKAAYEAMLALPNNQLLSYYGFPWATIIDGLRGDLPVITQILMELKKATTMPANTRRRITVAQHIHALQFVELFKACGITDLFWSHATNQQREVEGIQLHPFPLFPAQTANLNTVGDITRPRRYLANFIGAYTPKLYLTNVREVIFDDANKMDDLLIIRRDAWHFNRAVYHEQINGIPADKKNLIIEQQHTEEYLDAIKNSWFTLCPSGSGPNSIRIYESLCLGSIPIVLTRNLRLPGPQVLWEKASIIEEDSEQGYARAIDLARSLNCEHRLEMLSVGQALFKTIAPYAYGSFITNTIANL